MLSGLTPITKAKTMASRCTTGSEVGGHIFEINGYRFQKGIGVGKFVRSNIFAVGSFDWAIRFYPDGVCEAYKEYISVYLELMSDNAEVQALYSLRLVNQVPGLSNWELTLNKQPVVFSSRGKNRFGTVISHAYFKLRSDLELPESGFIKDNRLTIKCLLLNHMCVNLQGGDKIEMIRHLLVAADRYAMDSLKLICFRILGKSLHVDNVATTLALADQHSCDKLKKVCIEFMASSNAMDAVAATGGYANLKRTSPSLLVDVFEETSRLRKA
ncbi:BTB/POZ and MATH domain-containing protein 1-like [Oryza glaberrima]|uniref:BTB/POZ and MATH domain-containing protein 1-like n=1 Tax=Oryza glaberrima TaxID=4538 RepID=UPI00224BF6F8|nr:BTB/POZ and MATH domain-containing protein 1-like [Oryza glaberrima]